MAMISFFVVLLLFALNIVLLPSLPAQIPIHWNIRGTVDQYASKEIAVWILPIICALLAVFLKVLPAFDPKKKNYKQFKREWELLQTGILIFFAYLQGVILYISLHPGTPMTPLMFIGLGSLFVLIGYCLPGVRQNYFVGIKLPWTLSSERNWEKTHRVAGWCFALSGIIMLAEAYFQWNTAFIVFASIALAALIPGVYSYLLYRKK